jgi:hypothetical protein
MGEYISTSIKFEAEKLSALLCDYMLTNNQGDDPYPEILDGNEWTGEANYGDLSEIVAWACDRFLSIEHWRGGLDGGGPVITRYHDGKERTRAASESEAMVKFSELLQIDTVMSVFADLLTEAKWWAQPLTMEIIP